MRRKRLPFKLQRETELNWKRSYGGHMGPRKRSLPWSQEPHPLGSSKEAVVQESAEQERARIEGAAEVGRRASKVH